VAAIWQQDSNGGRPGIQANEQATSLLVVTVNVGSAPPDPTWTTLDGTFQQQMSPNPNLYRFAPAATPDVWTTFVKTT
jgi:hypothetical protein